MGRLLIRAYGTRNPEPGEVSVKSGTPDDGADAALLEVERRADGKMLAFTDDVVANVRFADEKSAELRGKIDDYTVTDTQTRPSGPDDRGVMCG